MINIHSDGELKYLINYINANENGFSDNYLNLVNYGLED